MHTFPVLKGLNLSLSSACGADCIFCPSDRGQRIGTKLMPFEIALKAIDEVSNCTEGISIESIQFGENGDAFINKNCMDILRYAKEKLPLAQKTVITNLQNLPADKIDELIENEFVDCIGLNIDGFDETSFFASKGLSLAHISEKLPKIIRAREKYQTSLRLHINILPVRTYVMTTVRVLGKLPRKLKNLNHLFLEDDSEKILAVLRPALRPTDFIGTVRPFLWAERESVDKTTLDYNMYQCPFLARVVNEAFIAPDGTWYACCLDSNNELDLGNITESSINEIRVSAKRINLIQSLLNKKFAEIGSPCDTVNCCNIY